MGHAFLELRAFGGMEFAVRRVERAALDVTYLVCVRRPETRPSQIRCNCFRRMAAGAGHPPFHSVDKELALNRPVERYTGRLEALLEIAQLTPQHFAWLAQSELISEIADGNVRLVQREAGFRGRINRGALLLQTAKCL